MQTSGLNSRDKGNLKVVNNVSLGTKILNIVRVENAKYGLWTNYYPFSH